MSVRPRKRRIRHSTEDEDHAVTRVGRVMHCHKCWETRYNKTRCTNQERPKPAYLKSKGIVFHDAPSSSMPPPTATPSISNTMPPPPTLSSSNTIPPSLTQSNSNTMPPPPTPSTSNIMPPLVQILVQEHQFRMDMEAVYEIEREQIANDEDDQFWENFAREFDQVLEHKAQDKGAKAKMIVTDQINQIMHVSNIGKKAIQAND
ncbi:hypothetical protein Tco_1128128 [Tanacetum coccineum]